MIPVEVDQLFFSNMGFVVLLRKRGEERALPIFIGAAEAQAIALHINKVNVPRPLTHDLLKNTLDFLECRLKRVVVSELKAGTFYARLILDKDGSELEMDSRPSDAIALSLRCGAPIFVADAVMEEAGRVLTDKEIGEQVSVNREVQDEPEQKEEKELTPLEMLQEKLDKLVEEERYEEAARLRDEIKQLKDPHAQN